MPHKNILVVNKKNGSFTSKPTFQDFGHVKADDVLTTLSIFNQINAKKGYQFSNADENNQVQATEDDKNYMIISPVVTPEQSTIFCFNKKK